MLGGGGGGGGGAGGWHKKALFTVLDRTGSLTQYKRALSTENDTRDWYKKAPLTQNIRQCWHKKSLSTESARGDWHKKPLLIETKKSALTWNRKRGWQNLTIFNLNKWHN